MQVVHSRCCGLDVHKKTVVACVLLTPPDGPLLRHTRTFSTMTADLLLLNDWLSELQVEQIAMESTGVYWRPIFNLLEDGRNIVLVNAHHMKAVPGRKTDVKDSEWIADLLRHGLLQPSFIPPQPIRELRELTRYRKTLVQERADEVNRVQKALETANIKLAGVASDVLGRSGRDMLNAIINGEQDPAVLADLARRRLRQKLPELRLALEGRVTAHHRFLLARILAHIDFLDQAISQVVQEIEQRLAEQAAVVARLQTIPGVNATAAAVIIAEIGLDMSKFNSAKHLASWAGVCPGNRESGGKRLSSKVTKGDKWLKTVLVEVACSIGGCKDNYLTAQYHRLVRRIGKSKAVIATAHSVLTIAYYILRDGAEYNDLGSDYFDQLDKTRIERHHIQRLEQLGNTVTLTPRAVA